MRTLAFLALFTCACACGGGRAESGPPTTQPAQPDAGEDVTALCRDLDSPVVSVRTHAADQLMTRVGLVEGGTEQQMEAVGDYCEQKTGIRPSWKP